jgi:tRNA (mo5U34)-methyltransferase
MQQPPLRFIREPRRGEDFSRELAEMGWYHSFVLPDGSRIEGYSSLDILKRRYARFPIPTELTGRRVLDIGAWDGWFSFEAERHGADVTAIDCVEVANFLHIHRKLSSRVDYRILDFYELPQARLGKFDLVFFLGVLYHLKHPLLALEIVCGLTTDTAIVESFVTDADTWQEHRQEVPTMEFYETDELGNQLDNWIGPSVACLMAMCRAAGLRAWNSCTLPASMRVWRASGEPVPIQPAQEPPELIAVANTRNLGVNFSTRKEDYITCWFRTSFRTPLALVTREQLRFEVSGFGVSALYVRDDGNGAWLANFRLPPGLDSGWQTVRLRLADSRFGRTLRIAVDMPLKVDRLVLKSVCDGITWSAEEISVRERGFITCWVIGLPENADRSSIGVHLGQTRLGVEFVGEADAEGCRQINAVVPGDEPKGEQQLRVECAGVSSETWPLKITG